MDDFEQLDYYELLGVERGASAEAIKRAYRQQMNRYHPDRFANASPAEQDYASRRSQRINEAYRVLSDFGERTAYNRSINSPGRSAAAIPRPPATPPPPRDHQAELYEQAREHMAAGRHMQAVATLRELQRLNPFYRDSAAMLAQAEAAAQPSARPQSQPRSTPDQTRRTLLFGGVGALALLGVGAIGWAMRRLPQSAANAGPGQPSTTPQSTSPVAVAGGVEEPTAPPASTSAPEPTAAPSPTTAPPTATPEPPTATTAPPTATPEPPTATPVPPSPTPEPLAETGELVYGENFAGARSWPQIDNGNWSVGYTDRGYQITAQPGFGNIWAYRTSQAGEQFQVAVDVEVSGGMAGLMLRFSESGRYLAFLVDPASGRFRLEDRNGRDADILLEEASPVISSSGTNRLLARLEGDRIELRINGQPVGDLVRSAPPVTPRYGLVAVAGSSPVTALFSNLALRAL